MSVLHRFHLGAVADAGAAALGTGTDNLTLFLKPPTPPPTLPLAPPPFTLASASTVFLLIFAIFKSCKIRSYNSSSVSSHHQTPLNPQETYMKLSGRHEGVSCTNNLFKHF